uniref:Uncharacterized protein n=1 Tax=Ditylenchus dipsaci TaxID=166011 RepID=A0A915ENE8_9BILA
YSKIEDGQKAYTTLMDKLTGQGRPLEDERYVTFCALINLVRVGTQN